MRELISTRLIRRTAFLATLVYLWWGLPWTLLILRVSLYVEGNYLFNSIALFWLFNTIFPLFPGAGFFATIVGAITKDRVVSFLTGSLPNWLTIIAWLVVRSAFGYAWLTLEERFPLAFLTLLMGGVGLGLMGLASAYRGSKARSDVLGETAVGPALLLWTLGLVIWLVVFWVWPGGRTVFPGF